MTMYAGNITAIYIQWPIQFIPDFYALGLTCQAHFQQCLPECAGEKNRMYSKCATEREQLTCTPNNPLNFDLQSDTHLVQSQDKQNIGTDVLRHHQQLNFNTAAIQG